MALDGRSIRVANQRNKKVENLYKVKAKNSGGRSLNLKGILKIY